MRAIVTHKDLIARIRKRMTLKTVKRSDLQYYLYLDCLRVLENDDALNQVEQFITIPIDFLIPNDMFLYGNRAYRTIRKTEVCGRKFLVATQILGSKDTIQIPYVYDRVILILQGVPANA